MQMNTYRINFLTYGMEDFKWLERPILNKQFGKDNSGAIAQSVMRLTQSVMHRRAAHHCIGGSNPDACKRSLASHAIYTLIQCTPLLVEKSCVAPEVNLRITQARKHARDPPWLWNPGQKSPEVQNRGISGPTKNLKKTKNKRRLP